LRWTWDPVKNEANRLKHELGFETANLVFNDPFSVTVPDPYPGEARWRTIGRVRSAVVIVIHTLPDGDEGAGRIISARKATGHERKAYEEGEF